MSGTLSPYPVHQFPDNNFDPASGAKLFVYDAGTSTKTTTYSDADLTVANTNPIILDSAGRCTIFLGAGQTVKYVLAPSTDSDPPTSPIWTRDGIGSVPPSNVNVDIAITAGEALQAGDLAYLSQGDGAKTAGKWYLADADLEYGSLGANSLGFVLSGLDADEAGNARINGRVTGLVGLTPGSMYYVSATAGEVTATSTSLAYKRRVGVADSSTSLIIVSELEKLTDTVGRVYSTTGNVDAGEDTIGTITIPASTVYRNGDAVRFCFMGATANNANAKTLKLHCDDGTDDTTLLTFSLTVSEVGVWVLGGLLIREDASTGRAGGGIICGPTNGPLSASAPFANYAVTVDWTAAVELRVTGEATTSNDVTCTMGSVRFESI